MKSTIFRDNLQPFEITVTERIKNGIEQTDFVALIDETFHIINKSN